MSKRWIALLVGIVAVVAVLGGAAWYLGFFEEPEEEVSIEDALESAQQVEDGSADGDTGVDVDGGDGDGDPDGAASGGEVTDLSGTWSVVAGPSFVGYRIDEVLTTVGDFTVVGRTEDVAGSIEASSTEVSAVELVVDMTTLTTDNSNRDQAMRGQALETDQFPEATFSLTSPIPIESVPAEGETIEVTATGDLTIHGVTQSVDFPLTAAIEGTTLVVVGQLTVLLADYDISAPSAPIVASVEDDAILELSLVLSRN